MELLRRVKQEVFLLKSSQRRRRACIAETESGCPEYRSIVLLRGRPTGPSLLIRLPDMVKHFSDRSPRLRGTD